MPLVPQTAGDRWSQGHCVDNVPLCEDPSLSFIYTYRGIDAMSVLLRNSGSALLTACLHPQEYEKGPVSPVNSAGAVVRPESPKKQGETKVSMYCHTKLSNVPVTFPWTGIPDKIANSTISTAIQSIPLPSSHSLLCISLFPCDFHLVFKFGQTILTASEPKLICKFC